MRNGLAAPVMSAVLLLSLPSICYAEEATGAQAPTQDQGGQSQGGQPPAVNLPSASPESAKTGQTGQTNGTSKGAETAPRPSPTKLTCRATRTDLGILEPLRIISITVDPAKKYVKMVHEGDGKTFEFTDGATAAHGARNFVKVTDETIVYGTGRESWRIDRYTGTLTNSSIAIPFECQLRPTERKF